MLGRLKAGRPYGGGVPRGWLPNRERVRLTCCTPTSSSCRRSTIRPKNTPSVSISTAASAGRPGPGWPGVVAELRELARADSIVVFPASWSESPWWQPSQIENIDAILDDLKRTHNIDENRAYVLGISDGATGNYYHAMLTTTPWAAFLPLNGQPGVLANAGPATGAPLYAANLADKPLFIVHGALDRLYPLPSVKPWWELLDKVGATYTTHVKEQSGHDTRWWPEEAPLMDVFIKQHPRDALPDKLTWETGQADRFNRAHWLLIDELGAATNEPALPSPNEVTGHPIALGMGIRVWGESRRQGRRPRLSAGGIRRGGVRPRGRRYRARARRRRGDDCETAPGRFGGKCRHRGPDDSRAQGAAGALGGSPPTRSDNHAANRVPAQNALRRIEVERAGNLVTVRTRGIREYILLLSSGRFDFSQPIKIVTNGATSFEGVVKPTAATVLKWAARDNDRTMLFGYEMAVSLPAAAVSRVNP